MIEEAAIKAGMKVQPNWTKILTILSKTLIFKELSELGFSA